MPIEIGGIIITIYILVVEHSDFNLILKRPFKRKLYIRTTNNNNKSITTKIFLGDEKIISTF